MKMYTKIRGTMATVPNIEVNKDTVYIRSNITKIEDDFKGYEYDEVQYDTKEYIENLTTEQDAQTMAIVISLLMSEIDCLKQRVDKLEGE